MQNAAHRIVSGAFAILGISVGFSSLRNQDIALGTQKNTQVNAQKGLDSQVHNAAMITNATHNDQTLDSKSNDGPPPQDYVENANTIACQTKYKFDFLESSNVLVGIDTYQNTIRVGIPQGYSYYPQAWLNGPRNFVLDVDSNGESKAVNVPNGTYVAGSALVGPRGELISCMPVQFDVNYTPAQ